MNKTIENCLFTQFPTKDCHRAHSQNLTHHSI